MSMDDEIQRLEAAEEKARKILAASNFRQANVQCCLTCKHSLSDGCDDELRCGLAETDPDWMVAVVHELDVCDKYEEVK